MDSAKITKLSLEEPDPETGFQAVALAGLGPSEERSPAPCESPKEVASESNANVGFGLPDQFWSWLSGDAGLKREFEKMIEVRVQERLEERFEQLKTQVMEEAEAAGMKRGLEASEQILTEMRQKIEAVCESVVKDKASLLRSHEAVWIHSFSHLLRRFLIHRSVLAADEIGSWLEESIGAFEAKGKIHISVSTQDKEIFAQAFQSLDSARWEIKSDPNLKEGEFHCACEDGGILFSSEEEMRKLENWIDRFTKGENT